MRREAKMPATATAAVPENKDITIIIAVIATAPYLTDKSEHTVHYKISLSLIHI